jgi:uncharacterized membrane protein
MNKQEKLKSLAWRFFWEQKAREIGKFFLILIGIGAVVAIFILVGYWSVQLGLTRLSEVTGPSGLFYFIVGLLWLMVVGAIVGLIFILALGFVHWIKSNWEEAQRRAQEESYGRKSWR